MRSRYWEQQTGQLLSPVTGQPPPAGLALPLALPFLPGAEGRVSSQRGRKFTAGLAERRGHPAPAQPHVSVFAGAATLPGVLGTQRSGSGRETGESWEAQVPGALPPSQPAPSLRDPPHSLSPLALRRALPSAWKGLSVLPSRLVPFSLTSEVPFLRPAPSRLDGRPPAAPGRPPAPSARRSLHSGGGSTAPA